MMQLVVIITLLAPLAALAQSNQMTDPRDGKSYAIGEVVNRVWMLEDLRYESALSFGFTAEHREKYPGIKARWYHMHELDSVCPQDWRLPALEDWMDYLTYLSEEADGKLVVRTNKDQISVTKIAPEYDLFAPGNPLNISWSGIFQGETFYRPDQGSADYWMQDMPTRETGAPNDTYKHVRDSYPNAAHIHFFNAHTNIHSHEHHLDPSTNPPCGDLW